jgi:Calcineurin-like phosphoesterase
MSFGAIGDLHGDFDALDSIMGRHPDVPFWLCPGDLVSPSGQYPHPIAPLYWIKGNNEDFDFVASQPSGAGTIPNLYYIQNGRPVDVSEFRLAGLGGTFAPTWYETPAAELPATTGKTGRGSHGAKRSGAQGHGTPARPPRPPRDDKRRHFVHEEVALCMRLTGVDVFLSHEAPRPYVLETRALSGPIRRIDAGKTPINDVLTAMRPRLHLFGHHHRYVVAERHGVTSIGLEKISDGYLLFDGKTLAHDRLAL